MKKNRIAQSEPARRSPRLTVVFPRRRLGEGGFFNLRFLLGLLIAFTGVILALLGFGTFAVRAASTTHAVQNYTAKSIDPLVPPGFDCSKIHELGIDKQVNLRAGAIMIFCGEAQGGSASPAGNFSRFVQKLLQPSAYGGTDVDLITGAETYPNITQSTTFSTVNPTNSQQIIVAYNDSRCRNFNPISTYGTSVSTDGGTTFIRLTQASGCSPFINLGGGPVALWRASDNIAYVVGIDGTCGSLGGYKSITPWDPNSWSHFNCANSGSEDDRESAWMDNNPSSPFYGRMYVSYNDFTRNEAIFVSFSSDGGSTWTEKSVGGGGNPFIRNVQITGDLVTGDVYIAGMDEGGGGFPHNDTNYFYRSTDGGNTWINTYTGAPFPGPGVTAVGYFACMFPDGGGYWRHEGWGEPAALNSVVHLVYAQHGTGSDPGDIYYIRSTDKGQTFSAPIKLNTDATTRPQWEPSLSVSPSGTLFTVWYDARETTGCTKGDQNAPCYRMWARKSTDNGVTWLPDDMFSDVVSPLPGQPDPGIVSTYVSDYDYASAVATKHVSSWVDGRVTINNASQQDAFTDRELVGAPSATPTATATSTPLTPTPTATLTPTPTPTSKPRPSPTPRIMPTPRERPTPPPRS